MGKAIDRNQKGFSFSLADKLAGLAFLITCVMFIFGSTLTLVPLSLYLLLCIIAPFFPQWSFFLPIISRSITDSKAVALTFDDGPCPVTTPIILQELKQYNFKATFFVIGEKVEKYPNLITDILADGHTIGNHSWQHDNLLMLRSKKRLEQDIKKTQVSLQKHSIRPLVFRPPAGITNPKLKSVLQDENLKAVTFSCRALDYGNKKIANLSNRIMSKLKPGDIILLHDLEPDSEELLQEWKQELINLFNKLEQKTHPVVPLEKLIGSKVMLIIQKNNQSETKQSLST